VKRLNEDPDVNPLRLHDDLKEWTSANQSHDGMAPQERLHRCELGFPPDHFGMLP
jgi:hypothetical protein